MECDCTFITQHTIGGVNVTGPQFLDRKDVIVAVLKDEIDQGDLETMAQIRAHKTSL